MPAPPDIQFGALSHERECPYCSHPDHRLRCLEVVDADVLCPCHGGPAPGIYTDSVGWA